MAVEAFGIRNKFICKFSLLSPRLRPKLYFRSETNLAEKKISMDILDRKIIHYPASIYLPKVNNRDTRTRFEICSKLTMKTLERRHWRRSGVFIVNFELVSHLALVFLLLTLNRLMLAGLVRHRIALWSTSSFHVGDCL